MQNRGLLPFLLLMSFAAEAQSPSSVTRSWTGTLYDSGRTACSTETKKSALAPGTCPVSVCTQEFGIKLSDGKLYKFDEGGNPKVADALRQSKKSSRVVYDYWKSGKSGTPISAKVTGSLTSDTFNLETVQID